MFRKVLRVIIEALLLTGVIALNILIYKLNPEVWNTLFPMMLPFIYYNIRYLIDDFTIDILGMNSNLIYLSDEEFDKMYNDCSDEMCKHVISSWSDFSASDVINRMKRKGYARRFRIGVGTGKDYDSLGEIKWSWFIGVHVLTSITVAFAFHLGGRI